MKKIITILLFIVCLQPMGAQTYVTIPDANFVTWLQTNIPSAMSGNQMDITSAAVASRTGLKVYNSNISDLTGVQYFTTLDTLDFTSNQVASLPILPNSITYLRCFNNLLTNISVLPSSLLHFNCGRNDLTSLPILPSSLTYLQCTENQLSGLPSLPNTLTSLVCSENLLMNLPSLPNSLLSIYCSNNQLSNLPVLPNSLQSLTCSNNQLSILPVLPNSLAYLDCSHNQLVVLPALSTSLNYLDCSYNQLSGLPFLPNSLANLYCQYNQLSSLPALPTGLSRLDCSYNQLTSLPSLPVGLSVLNCSHNNISCFPVFPNMPLPYIPTPTWPVKALIIDYNSFTCLPNYVGAMDTALLNYPLCVAGNTLTNLNGCATGIGITGMVYRDLNTDCMKNSLETGITNAIVKLYDNSNAFLGLTNTQTNNNYIFNVQAGTYKVVLDTLNKPYAVQCIDPGIDSLVTLTSAQTVEDSVDFAVVCKPGFDVGVQSIYRTGPAFPGVTHTLTVVAGDMSNWSNLNCASGVSGTVSFSVNGPVTYISPAAGALTPNVVGNVYSYTIADFGLVNNATDFRLVFKTDTTAQAGDMICINATVTPIAGDNIQSNNMYQYCYYVVNSYDPNIKEVYPVTVQPNFTDWLTYTIHFQNTGNANAINIRLQDVLDAKLNPETFEVLSYSHNNMIDLTGNNLTVRFPDIQLPDSTSNSVGSKGFIQYRIKPKAGWVNDTIRNSAGIYFDYNAPIITNTAKTYFMTTTGVSSLSFTEEQELRVFPNPANDRLTITGRQNLQRIELSTIAGQLMLTETINAKEHQLQLQDFAEGIYFVKCTYANGMSVTRKVIKQ